MSVIEKVRNFLEREVLKSEPVSILAAVSGGVDSMVMLDCLHELRGDLDLRIVVAHLDHRLRGESSRKDALFVGNQAEKRNLKFVKGERKVKEFAKKNSLSTEEAARVARYEFLRSTCQKQCCDFIALGHQKDDQAETVMLNLIRGAGLKGLSGMNPVRGEFIRPLLECSREEIKAYARKRDLPWHEDETNREVKYRRNKIRNELLPSLEEEYNPNIKETLARTAHLLSEVANFTKGEVEESWKEIRTKTNEEAVRFSHRQLDNYHRYVKKEIIRRAIKELRGNLSDITYTHVTSVLEEINDPKPRSKIHLPGEIIFEKTQNYAQFARETKDKASSFTYNLPSKGKKKIREIGWEFDLRPSKLEEQIFPEDPLKEYVDLNKFEGQLKVRNRREGDRFTPLGMKGTKKLKDFFIDENVPYHQRDSIPIVCDQQGIIWVVGFRLEEKYKIDEDTEEVLEIEAKKI